MTAQRFTKKPVTIEAVQYDGTNAAAIREWQQQGNPLRSEFTDDPAETDDTDALVWDYLHQTWVGVTIGDWIIRGVKGEFYPCADAVLQETYVPAEAGA